MKVSNHLGSDVKHAVARAKLVAWVSAFTLIRVGKDIALAFRVREAQPAAPA
jgi:hypothetical protein